MGGEDKGPPDRIPLLAPPVATGPPAPLPPVAPPVAPELLMMVTMLREAETEGADGEGEDEGPPDRIKLLALPVLPGPPEASAPLSPPVCPAVEMTVIVVRLGAVTGPPAPWPLVAAPVPAGAPETMK